jgi:hypothetical protein
MVRFFACHIYIPACFHFRHTSFTFQTSHYLLNMSTILGLIFCSLLVPPIYAVTIIPLTLNLPKPYENPVKPASSDYDLLFKINPDLAGGSPSEQIDQSSYSIRGNLSRVSIYAAQDSFVRGAIDASAKHQHLVLRPQDVWLTMLTQLSFYMRKHKDDTPLRDMWDNFDTGVPPKNNLWIMFANGMDNWAQRVFKQRNKTNWLLDWVLPAFQSAPSLPTDMKTSDEELIANALMMARSTPSIEEIAPFPCKNGIPSITLLGKQADWMRLADKLTQMEKGSFGNEPRVYATSLRPILARAIATFDNPNDPAIRLFWNDMVTITAKQKLCQTTDVVTGWINALHFWDGNGNPISPLKMSSDSATNNQTLQLDNIIFPGRNIKDLPTAYSYVAMCVSSDSMWESSTGMLVGMMAKSIQKGIPEGYMSAMQKAGFTLPPTVVEGDHSILQPLPAHITHHGKQDVSFLILNSGLQNANVTAR